VALFPGTPMAIDLTPLHPALGTELRGVAAGAV
jgi:hypothetical protein